MAKKDRFPDGYSSGFNPPNAESEGSGSSGSSGRVDAGGPRKKWINLSSATRDGFNVPIQVLPLSKMSDSEKKNLALRLKSELDQVRILQKRVNLHMNQAASISSSSDILPGRNVQTGNHAVNARKSTGLVSGPGKRINPTSQKARGWNRGVTGRFASADETSGPGTFNVVLMKQCESLLKKLMTHQYGWVFNTPVDVVKLKIPDYFTVIKTPMDLGTVKRKISSCSYLSPLDFLSDVRLTFSNAMTYNPPGNDVHIMADTLSKFFELRWKSIERKLPGKGSQPPEVHDEIDLVKPMPPSKKRKVDSMPIEVPPEPAKPVMTDEEKSNLRRELESSIEDLPDNIIEFLRDQSAHGMEVEEDEIEIDINDLGDETLLKLRKLLDDHLQEKQNRSRAEPCEIELLNESGLSNSTMQLYKGNDLADEDVDIGENEPPVSSYPPVEIEKDEGRIGNKHSPGSSSDSDSSSSSDDESDAPKASSPANLLKEDAVDGPVSEGKEGLDDLVDGNQSVSGLDQLDQISQPKPSSAESDSRQDDGDSAPPERQLSPEKQYRAAVLKNRFADTILKAREKTLNQGQNVDPEKLRREKEELENQRRKEKARLQAEAKAAEDARKRAEEEAAAEARKRRELEREAARQALLKMEKTVEINGTSRFLEDLEMLRTVGPEQLPSSVDESSPEPHLQDGLGSFNFGGSNALEQLGLFMKEDEIEEDEEGEPPSNSVPKAVNEDEEGELPSNSVPNAVNEDEEGELLMNKAVNEDDEGELPGNSFPEAVNEDEEGELPSNSVPEAVNEDEEGELPSNSVPEPVDEDEEAEPPSNSVPKAVNDVEEGEID